MHRVAITGIGCISPVGLTAPASWQALKAGVSGIAPTQAVPVDKLHIKIAAEVKGFDPAAHFDERRAGVLDRFAKLAVVAAREAIADSGLRFDDGLGRDTAVIVGTGVGGIDTMDAAYERLYGQSNPRVHPLTVPRLMVSAAASHITMDQGITGPSFAVSSACSSANHAIGEAFWMVRTGRVKAAVTGGCEAAITFGPIKGWEALRVMAPDACRPFSKGRKGMVLGEGAGMVVLEPLEDARARGATIHAELAGFGMTADAGDLVLPDEAGGAGAMARALADAGLNAEDVDYINAHGTGTAANDATETRAVHRVFGAHARALAISSTKSMHGHALGAAGALELVATLMALREGVIPPTIGYQAPDPACDLDYTPNEARERPIRAALSNSFAFGGLNAVLAVRRPD
jgi:nodulation protein E